ncbi:hypothetical protein Scep_021578 [Stephania cephalantha]|uniref:Uncharacterized protein n=1 Tax=Stephania cephalantha TaxID=152367 RepID=A0AAP0F4L1_9MAGN
MSISQPLSVSSSNLSQLLSLPCSPLDLSLRSTLPSCISLHGLSLSLVSYISPFFTSAVLSWPLNMLVKEEWIKTLIRGTKDEINVRITKIDKNGTERGISVEEFIDDIGDLMVLKVIRWITSSNNKVEYVQSYCTLMYKIKIEDIAFAENEIVKSYTEIVNDVRFDLGTEKIRSLETSLRHKCQGDRMEYLVSWKTLFLPWKLIRRIEIYGNVKYFQIVQLRK